MPSQLAGLCAQGPAGDAEEGGPGLLPAGLPQDAGQQQPIASFRAGADGRFSRLAVVRISPHHHGQLADQAGDLQRLAEHGVQLLQVQRLEQVVVRPDAGPVHARRTALSGRCGELHALPASDAGSERTPGGGRVRDEKWPISDRLVQRAMQRTGRLNCSVKRKSLR